MDDTYVYKFELLDGYFVDYSALAKTYPREQVATQPKLGLIDRTYDNEKTADVAASPTANQSQWARFERHVRWLNETSPEGTSYKLFYLLRHGTGIHNFVMDKLYEDREKWDKEGKNWRVRRHGTTAQLTKLLTANRTTGLMKKAINVGK